MSELIYDIPLKEILVDPIFNSRGQFSATTVVDLARDIEQKGLIQPIILTNTNFGDFKYKLVAGFRRFMAHELLKSTTIKAIIKENISEKDARLINLSENLVRKDLNILQEALSIQPLLALGMSETDIAFSLPSISRGWVQIRCMLLRLPKPIQDEAAAGLLTQIHIRDLYSLKCHNATDEKLFEVTKDIKNKIYKSSHGSSIVAKQSLKNLNKKEKRDRPEIFDMINHIMDNKLPGLHTRCLSWAAGEISSQELFVDIRQYAEEKGVKYQSMEILNDNELIG